MKALIDFLPIILFFASYQFYGIYVAVVVMIIASVIQVGATRILHKRYEKAQVIGLIAMVLFGGLTLWLKSPAFIMWKVSVINVLFGLVLIISLWVGKKPLIAYIMDKQVLLSNKSWAALTTLWAMMFFLIALINSYFVVIATNARDKLVALDSSFANLDLQTISCKIDLCTQAKITEEAWVNFKLFGALGITVVFLIISASYIYKQQLK